MNKKFHIQNFHVTIISIKMHLSFSPHCSTPLLKYRMSICVGFPFLLLLFLFKSASCLFSIPASRPFSSKYFASEDGLMRVARPVAWTDCSSPDALFHLESLDLSPDPPQRSSPLTVHLRGHLKERLEGAQVNYTASFGGLQLVQGSEDGCGLLAKEGKGLPQCPIEAGEIEVTHEAQLPWHVPPGRYLIDLLVSRKDDGREVVCLKLDVVIDLIRSG